MCRISVCLLAGAFTLQFAPLLPTTSTAGLLWLLATALAAFRQGRALAAFMVGALALWAAASADLANRLDPDFPKESFVIVGEVLDVKGKTGGNFTLLLRPVSNLKLPRKLRLSWYNAPVRPQIDEVWRLHVRLRRPRGLANPNSFDFARWMHREHIGASGYVLNHADNSYLRSQPRFVFSTARAHAASRIDDLLPPDAARAVLKAIAVGDRDELSPQQWQLFARTGTSHLMAISGLHVGMAATCAGLLIWVLLAIVISNGNVRDKALVGAFFLALFYVGVSGFGVPAQRALMMLGLLVLAVKMRRRIDTPTILALVALCVFGTDPLVIYAPGFQLSFTAVAALIWLQKIVSHSPLRAGGVRSNQIAQVASRLWQVQLCLLFALTPLTLFIFGRIAVAAPLANMLVLPLFNLLIVPASLLGLLLDGPLAPAGDCLLRLAAWGLQGLLQLLAIIDSIPYASLQPPILWPAVLLPTSLMFLWVLLPPGFPARSVAILALISSVLQKPAAVPDGCVDMQVLDVGQGLAVILRTRNKTLVYDTGPVYMSGASAAERTLIPVLTVAGIKAVDRVIVSHADLDHSGGLPALLEAVTVGSLLSGEVQETGGTPCVYGQVWQWDGVQFEILHPADPSRWEGNDASCVLLVTAGRHRLLFPGDIELSAEQYLAERLDAEPMSVVLVPHHGSKTSSGSRLVEALRPDVALVSAGFGNRWGFPKESVVRRWESVGSALYSTGDAGALRGRYCSYADSGRLWRERIDAPRYWRDPSAIIDGQN